VLLEGGGDETVSLLDNRSTRMNLIGDN